MSNRFEGSAFLSRANILVPLTALFLSITLPALASTQSFRVPDDVALRIRLDDTLTSADSQVGDPFSATVVDKGDYQNARAAESPLAQFVHSLSTTQQRVLWGCDMGARPAMLRGNLVGANGFEAPASWSRTRK
jgi:hypothetical protein